MVEFDFTAWLVGLALLLVLLAFLYRRGVWFLLFFSIFWVYLMVLVSLTLFPIPVLAAQQGVGGIWQQLENSWLFGSLNLQPLYFGRCWDELPDLCAMGIGLNILMTVPFGFGINFLARRSVRQFVWLAFLPGLVIESSQLLMSLWLGITYRSVDVNDVIFNTLGVWLGYAVFRIFAWFYKALIQRLKLKQRGLFAYLLSVTE